MLNEYDQLWILVGGLVAIWIIFPFILGVIHHPNWRTHIFQRGGPTTNQPTMNLNMTSIININEFTKVNPTFSLSESRFYGNLRQSRGTALRIELEILGYTKGFLRNPIKRCWTGWWFGTFGLFSHILGIIIPIDVHIFQRGGPTTNQWRF